MINEIDVRSSQINVKLDALDDYAKRTHLPREIVAEVQNYIRNNSYNDLELGSCKEVLDELPDSVKCEIAKEKYRGIVSSVKFF